MKQTRISIFSIKDFLKLKKFNTEDFYTNLMYSDNYKKKQKEKGVRIGRRKKIVDNRN